MTRQIPCERFVKRHWEILVSDRERAFVSMNGGDIVTPTQERTWNTSPCWHSCCDAGGFVSRPLRLSPKDLRQLIATLAPDRIGSGERTAGGYARTGFELADATPLLETQPGMTLLGLMLFDVTRCIDYLESRPEVDGRRLPPAATRCSRRCCVRSSDEREPAELEARGRFVPDGALFAL